MVGRRDMLKRGAGGLGALVVGGGAATAIAQEDPPRKYVLLVLDRSGSMIPLVKATIDGVNLLLEEQRGTPDMAIGIIQFDSSHMEGLDITETRDFQAASTIALLQPHEFTPTGSTPLLAAFVEGVRRLERVVRPQDKALMVIQTDGGENASPHEITKDVVQRLKQAKEDEGNFTFAFMGAGLDAWGESATMGIGAGSSLNYANSPTGTVGAYATTSGSTQSWAISPDASVQNFYDQQDTVDASSVIPHVKKRKRPSV